MPEGADTITTDPAAGPPPTLTGRDVATREVGGVFSALLGLYDALINNDLPGIERAVGMLDDAFQTVNFARAELGARQQALDAIRTRMEDEDVQLRDMLSKDFDADLVEVISELTARQTAFEAALQSSAQILSLTLLDYL